jgi:hypothetical protein
MKTLFLKIFLQNPLRKLVFALILISLISFYMAEYYSDTKYWNLPSNYDKENQNKLSFFNIFYFNIVSWFTIGFGDFTPKHVHLKLITILYSCCAYVIALL